MSPQSDFYLGLLELASEPALESLLGQTLDLVMQRCGARKGLVEFWHGEQGPRFSMVRAFDEPDLARVRASFSSSIIKGVIESGQTVSTASALLDPRFSDFESVRSKRNEAVICAPVGVPPQGVLYLEGAARRGPFSEAQREQVELLARYLSPHMQRLLDDGDDDADPTRPWREKLGGAPLVGRSAAMAELLRAVTVVAPTQISVLLTGETGVGKTAVARLIADRGPRANRPVVVVNCATLERNMFESTLFGAERGAYTGADRARRGLVAEAEGGTLVLDEVTELTPERQAKLLQFLQSGVYYPVGSSRPKTADVRLLAASNRDMTEELNSGRLRRDLFDRLAQLRVHIPPLAARVEDIPLLMNHLARQACQVAGLRPLPFSPSAVRVACQRSWPGNVRELNNAVRQGVVYARADGQNAIYPEHLFPEERAPKPVGQRPSFRDALAEAGAGILKDAMRRHVDDLEALLTELDMSRSSFYELKRRYALQWDR